jgi:hypothetical protein
MRTSHARRIRAAINSAKSDIKLIESGTTNIKHVFGTEWEHEAYRRTFLNLEIREGIEYFVSLESHRYFEGYHESTQFKREDGETLV